MQLNELKQVVAAAGVVGAGGAGFPTAVKIAAGADTLVINAAECEPLLHTDYAIMKTQLATMLAGAEAVIEAAGMQRGVLGIKKHNLPRLGLSDGQQVSAHVRVHALPDVYPMGDEIILVYETLGRVIAPGALPLTVGAIVSNAETLYNVARAMEGTPVYEKWVTIGGKVPQTMVVKVPVGMRVSELLKKCGVDVPMDCVVVDGGPAMGPVIDPNTSFVKKTTKGITIYPRDIPAITGKLAQTRVINIHALSNCCQCTRCTDLCPRGLIGYPLQPHKIVRASMDMVEEMPQLFTGATSCSGCGVCELVACCQEISPRRVYAQVKGILAKNKLRYSGGAAPVDLDRDYRMVPSDRFARMIGVEQFESEPVLKLDTMMKASEITLLTRQHVGAPAVPCVQVGDIVEPGMVVAQANGMISANIHASVHGRVTAVSDSAVVIAPQN